MLNFFNCIHFLDDNIIHYIISFIDVVIDLTLDSNIQYNYNYNNNGDIQCYIVER